jgi:predicted PurR-regulated permease PerM
MMSIMRNRILAAFVTFHMFLFVTSPSFAAMIPSLGSSTQERSCSLQRDITTIQQTLETKIVQEKLKAYGLSADEVTTKIISMTPHQIHLSAVASPDILTGGDAGTVILVVGVVMTVFALYTLTNFIIGSSTK